ncbi:hypothetical protein D9619_013193 [Psilocybe cf. subviscida]|uniref:MYND-type domain-containing protein n=1 Tax=Psilocybe cf. subviscida TaxID=2480587 RepID=A0A8H5B8D4_9AGAR|nr:hypothetical protein D9619_013193 [Psilocybe cf. subviscida]
MDKSPLKDGRTVYRPLEKMVCAVCRAAHTPEKKIRVCLACGEVAYCSQECQESDWTQHKRHCGKGKTDRVQLQSFYPLLAVIAYSARLLLVPNNEHPALCHQIINNPDPITGDVVDCPNGEAARLVLLGDPISPHEAGSPEWWPSASSAEIRSKLQRRILTEGLLLPMMLAITVSLVGEMYTSNAVPSSEEPQFQATGRRRVRLTYKRSPISDFGIIAGSARVTAQDRLVYYQMDGDLMMGQDPEDHYWVYFTTVSGEEVYLDCGMYTFNFAVMVQSIGYLIHGIPDVGLTPASWMDREQEKFFPTAARDKLQWMPRKRFSILRDERLDKVLRPMTVLDSDLPVLYNLMDEIAGRSCTEWEKNMFRLFLSYSSRILRLTMKHRDYLQFPEQPRSDIDFDPGEGEVSPNSEYGKVHVAYLEKLTHKLKKHQITADEWTDAFKRWSDTPFEARKKMLKKFK